jgi:predicted Rossmann fold nucleotide-binding protein DprA/Smf involved in DNA uptake
MRLGIVGSRSYTNSDRIKKIIEKYIEQYGADNLAIVSGGCPNGGDFLAKKLALDMKLKYVEFPPIHSKHNSFCVKPASDYNKPYHVSNFFTRNTEIAEYCDHVVAFVVEGIKASGSLDTIRKAEKLKKIVTVFEDKSNDK